MNVRWMAVLTGFIVDTLLTSLLYALFYPQTLSTPEALPTNDLVFFGLGVLATGVGGYVAGRMAQAQRELHGLLVGVVGILVFQLELAVSSGPGPSHAQVIALGAGCLVGALGGLLSRLPPLRRPPQ
jgi:putative membrane protein (TIGR04086 family)